MKPTQRFFERTNIKRIFFFLLLSIGVIIRLIHLGALPAGVDQDEAMAAYQAYTILKEGIDLNGYHNPVYFEAWGNGMNALEIYLMIPCIQLFNMSEFSIRIPQALFACLSLPVFYLLIKRLFGERIAWIGYFLLVINPWHIMMSRWALESNLAPAFLLFGVYFFILAIEKHPMFFLLSALMYGLSLYTYAVIWIAVPIILIVQLLYTLLSKRTRFSWHIICFVIIVGLFALPLITFVLINLNLIPEVRTSFFSIPKMAAFRDNEFLLRNMTNLQSFSQLFSVLSQQSDGFIRNSFPQFGLYYLFSTPFILLGVAEAVKATIVRFRNRCFSLEFFALIQIFAALIVALLLKEININRINSLHIPMILFCAVGVNRIFDFHFKTITYSIFSLYCISFLAFTGYYFGQGQKDLSEYYRPGTKQAIEYAQELTDDIIVCRMQARYSKILYYLELPLNNYFNTVIYKDPPYPDPIAFDHFIFEYAYSTNTDKPVYIIEDNMITTYIAAGYSIQLFDRMAVAYLKD